MLKYSGVITQIIFIVGLLLRSAVALAGNVVISNTSQPSIQLTLSKQKDSAIHLEVRRVPLGQVLKEIASKTGASIHYSVLPEAPVTATCAGATVRQVLDCLLAKQAGLVAYSPKQGKPAEFWLLGFSAGSFQTVTVERAAPQSQAAATGQQPEPTPEEIAQTDQAMQEQSDLFLEQAKAKDPVQRAEAIANLESGGVKNDPNVRKALEIALTDKDANVRAQAITALAQREGDGVAEELRQALKDSDVSVRLMVVENAGNDSVLLQQALADKDPMIRDYAASKLEVLNTTDKGN